MSPVKARLPAIRGERPNIWLYIHGPTHHQAIRQNGRRIFCSPLRRSFSTVDALLNKSFASYPQAALTAAWEAQLYPDHGWGGKNGDITDSMFRAKYESARDVANRFVSSSDFHRLARQDVHQALVFRLVVFNSLSWKRSGPVQVTVTPEAGWPREDLTSYDAGGNTQSRCTVNVKQQHPDGSIASAELLFVARDVPPVGYVTYYVRPSSAVQPPMTQPRGVTSLENTFYRLVARRGGSEADSRQGAE